MSGESSVTGKTRVSRNLFETEEKKLKKKAEAMTDFNEAKGLHEAPGEAPVLRIDKLEKRYDDFTLEPFSMSITRNRVCGLVGSNGAGKTTILKSIFAAYRPDGGLVSLFGHTLEFGVRTYDRLREKIGFVFDTLPFGPLTIKGLSRIGRATYEQWDQGYFERSLAKADIKINKKCNELSRGMGMRLQLAFALAHRPEFLVLDEPTAGLDPIAREDVLDMLRNFMANERHAILISSHITSDIESIADTIVCLDKGRTVFSLSMDTFQDCYGVFLCTDTQRKAYVKKLAACGVDSWSIDKKIHSETLVNNREQAEKVLPKVEFARSSLDEMMLLTIKGHHTAAEKQWTEPALTGTRRR